MSFAINSAFISIPNEFEMSQPWPSFIAAQRNQCTLNSSRPQSGNVPLWTAGRCQRLLRPIISGTELLRKNHTRSTNAGVTDSIKSLEIPEIILSNVTTKRSRECKEENRCWARNKKRARRTYTVRSKILDISNGEEIHGHWTASEKRNQGHKPRLKPGEFLILTPILKRSKSLAMNSGRPVIADLVLTASSETSPSKPARPHHGNKGGEMYYDLAECMHQVRKKTSVARFKVYEGIYNSLEVLLKTVTLCEEQLPLSVYDTSTGHVRRHIPPQKNSRSKSLFAMCLRSIPSYMKEQEKFAAFEAEAMGKKTSFDTYIISAEIYADLESLGTSHGGWEHLETVVRVHGIKVICDAIEDSLLDADIASVLVMLCVHMSVPDEAGIILASLLKSCVYPAPKSLHSHFRDDSTWLPLLTLEKFFKYTGITSFYHCQLTSLLASGSLAITWLGTKQFTPIWTSLFHTLSTDPFDHDAINFMTTALPLLYKAQLSSFERREHLSSNQLSMLSVLDATLASVLTTLLAMSKLSSAHLRSVSLVLKSTIIDCKLVSSKICGHASPLVVMANLLSIVEDGEDIGFIQELVRYFGKKSQSLLNRPKPEDRIPSFIYSVAQCSGKVSSKDGFEHLKAILERLMAFESSDNPEGTYTLRQMVLDSAFAFASHRPDARHLQYAKLIGTNTLRPSIKSRAIPSTCRTDPDMGFRWEEGINEWVMATPALKSGRGDLALSLIGSDSECQPSIQVIQTRNISMCPVENTTHSDRLSRVSDLTPETPPKSSKDSFRPVRKHHLSGNNLRIQDLSQGLSSPTHPRLCKRTTTKLCRAVRNVLWPTQNYSFRKHDDDDELSSDPSQNVLREQSNTMKHGSNVRQRKKLTLQKPRHKWRDDFLEQSEDELGLNS